MNALIPWLTATFGQFGGALVFIVLLVLGVMVVRYAFWMIVTVLVAWKMHRDTRELRRDRR